MSDQAPNSTQESGRDAQGKFAPNNPGGPGNPFARQVAALRQALLDSVTSDDMAAIAQALTERAKKGEVSAAKLLLAYTLGKPAAPVQPDRLDYQEWQIYRRNADMGTDFSSLCQNPGADFPLHLVRTLQPMVSDHYRTKLGEHLRTSSTKEGAAPEHPPSPNGKKGQRTQPSANGKKPPPSLLDDPVAWFVDLNLVPPSPDDVLRGSAAAGSP